MPIDEVKQQLLELLEPVGQQHLLAFWDELDDAGRRRLAAQIRGVDLQLVVRLARGQDVALEADPVTEEKLCAEAQPPDAIRLDDVTPERAAQARQAGEQALRAGQLAVVLVAGGQGTRLGFEHPKGLYPLGPASNRSLYQILLERVLAVSRRYGVRIPLYVMTSPATHEESEKFLRSHNWFGLPQEDVRLFCQGTMPAVDFQGRILLESKDSLALAPDGHGGMLAALARTGCLDDAARRGIEHIFYGHIDNPLLQICDPLTIGHHLMAQSEMTTQVVAKAGPLEKVGNFVRLSGRSRVIEYIDLPATVAAQTSPDGSLRLWAGSIGVHVMALNFLQRMADRVDALPFHRASKKVPYIDQRGRRVRPREPNAIKFERFIFDLLPYARNALAVEVDRASAFAPVKNPDKEKIDTPAIARQMMVALHRKWLKQAGVPVADDRPVEISPLVALDPEELAQKIAAGLVEEDNGYFILKQPEV